MIRHRMRIKVVAFLTLVAICGSVQAQPKVQDLPIKRVILYKHGVGYFERIGSVEGDARVVLHFKAKHMSDLLKSLTVLDLGGGAIRNIVYDSTKTVDQQLAEYTFDLRRTRSLHEILEQMKGSEVTLKVSDRVLSGRILAVEKRIEHAGANIQVERFRISLLMKGAIVKHYDLSDVSDIQFTDTRLQKELDEYLGVLFSRHRRDEKEVVILAGGKGRRKLFVSYVQEQPVWKVSYRLVIAGKQKPLLQAWAIVDNVSTEDWKDVELSLVSGLPVSFIQNLYDPFYVKRREIRLQRETAMGPVIHEAGELRLKREVAQRRAAERKKMAVRGRKAGALLMEAEADKLAAAPRAPRPDMMAGMAHQAVQAVAQATGALFVYNIKEPVTVRRDRSALLPIANARVTAKRVGLYNERTRSDNPMDAVKLKNTTGLTLEGGPITVIEDNTYVGEALIDTLKPDEERYVSFAVDLGTRVNTKHGSTKQDVYRVRIAHGSMITYHKRRETKVYNLSNLEDKLKRIIIEHPVRHGWKLVDTPAPAETTKNLYRFEVKLPAREKVAFKVTEERPGQTTYSISNLNRDRIQFFLRQKYIDGKTRDFLAKVVALQAEINRLRNEINAFQKDRQSIFSDQSRLRSTLKSLGTTEAEKTYRGEIIRKLRTQDSRIEAIAGNVKRTELSIQQKQRELNRMLRRFMFETRVK